VTSTTNHTNKETNVQYEKINQNSLAQFMRTRVSIAHLSADLYRWIDKAGALHVGVTKPGTTMRTDRHDEDLRRRFRTGKQYRRAKKLVRRLLREEQATAHATA
jgi:hypothetical protein